MKQIIVWVRHDSEKKEKLGKAPIWVFPKIGEKNWKWMVYNVENPIKMDDLGPTPIFGNTHLLLQAQYFYFPPPTLLPTSHAMGPIPVFLHLERNPP